MTKRVKVHMNDSINCHKVSQRSFPINKFIANIPISLATIILMHPIYALSLPHAMLWDRWLDSVYVR